MRESAVEAYLSMKVKLAGGISYKFNSAQHNGVPDRLVLLPGGIIFFVELKATGKKPTAAQLREHERMRRMGQRVEVIDSIEGVDELLC